MQQTMSIVSGNTELDSNVVIVAAIVRTKL